MAYNVSKVPARAAARIPAAPIKAPKPASAVRPARTMPAQAKGTPMNTSVPPRRPTVKPNGTAMPAFGRTKVR